MRDFCDLILHCVKIFENNKDIGNVFKNFKYILVDEY